MPTVKGVRQAGDMSGSIELATDKVITRYSLEYLVIADNTSQGSLTIRGTSGLPRVGVDTYSYQGESDTTAVCKRKSPKRDPKQPLIWYVRCDFDNDPNSQSQETEDDRQDDATLRPPIIQWDAEYGEEVLYEDFSDPPVPVLNPVEHQFDPPPTKRVIYPVLVIQRYELSFTPTTILNYVDHVNENAFYGAAAGHALMARISAGQVVEDGQKLWDVTYRIRFATSADGFDLKPLNQGTHYSSGAYTSGDDSTLEPFLKGNVPYVGNLNANGTQATGSTRTYSTFKPYAEADFDNLNLE